MSLKSILGAVLAPAARLAGKGEGLRRLWAHARLASMITGRLDASVVVLGVPEIRGTGRISPGRNLFLYRELYLETEADGAIEIGDNVVISRGAHIVSFASVKIGANCMIGEYTSIRDANHRLVPGVAVRATPSTRIFPDDGARNPARLRSRVDLPQPFGPTMAVTVPGPASRPTPRSTGRLP